jgi:hypothetical protein
MQYCRADRTLLRVLISWAERESNQKTHDKLLVTTFSLESTSECPIHDMLGFDANDKKLLPTQPQIVQNLSIINDVTIN